MRNLLIISLLLAAVCLQAQQDADPFDKYGPPGVVYTNLKEALKDADMVYKLRIHDQPFEPKLLPKLGSFSQLQALELASNGLTLLPVEIKNLKNMVYFASIGNALTALPKDFSNIADLMELRLHSTNLDSIPSEIAYLGRLRTLEIQNNTDTLHFPVTIGYLSGLTSMVVFNTIIDTLPGSFGNIKKLKELTLVMCGLKEVPKPIVRIATLEQLYLDNNSIKELPSGIFKMKKLKYLSLKSNNLTHIPDSVCLLKDLEVLDLRGNKFAKYDIEIMQALLPKCRILY